MVQLLHDFETKIQMMYQLDAHTLSQDVGTIGNAGSAWVSKLGEGCNQWHLLSVQITDVLRNAHGM